MSVAYAGSFAVEVGVKEEDVVVWTIGLFSVFTASEVA